MLILLLIIIISIIFLTSNTLNENFKLNYSNFTPNTNFYISKKINKNNEMEYYFTNQKPVSKNYREIDNNTKNLKYGSCYFDLLKCNDFILKSECDEFIKQTNNPNLKWSNKPCL